ncbi:hypothetical protein D3C71_544610 [compost metagenome]
MWSVKYKTVSLITESSKTKCKVCKEEGYKDILTEKKRLIIFYLIPIRVATQRIEICPVCNARMKVKESSELIDSKI